MPVTVYPWQQAQWQELLQRRAALPHALLFRGREGTGKLDFVRKLAQSLACPTPVGERGLRRMPELPLVCGGRASRLPGADTRSAAARRSRGDGCRRA